MSFHNIVKMCDVNGMAGKFFFSKVHTHTYVYPPATDHYLPLYWLVPGENRVAGVGGISRNRLVHGNTSLNAPNLV